MTAPMYDMHDSDGLIVGDGVKMRTFTGRKVDPLALASTDIDVADIAHHLALQCRYNGACFGHLSVARHSLWVSALLNMAGHDAQLQLWGLLHDAAETYLGDMIRPLKHRAGVADAYLEAEAHAEQAIADRFLLPYPMPAEVKEADREVQHTELNGMRHNYDGNWHRDEVAFLERFQELHLARMGVKHGTAAR